MAGSSSSCPSDSEETKIITSSIPKHDTVTRRHEDEPAFPSTNVKQGATSRDVRKRSFHHFLSFISDTTNPIGYATTTIHSFINDSIRLVRRCNKPDGQEFQKIAYACSIGFFLMGFIGYFVKLFFIPINNIIVSK